MVFDPSWQPFVHFLTASVRDIHPTAAGVSEWLTPGDKVNTAKEIAYQQRKFVDFTKTLIDTQPWVTFLTCIKHRHIEERYELSAASFPEMADKRFWDELTVDVQETRALAEERLDAGTIEEVKELCEYQSVADKIATAPETLKKLRELSGKIKIKPNNWSIIVGAALLVPAVLALLGTAVIGITELRTLLVSPEANLEDLQNNLTALAVLLGVFPLALLLGGVMEKKRTAAYAAQYMTLFTTDIAPCLRLAHVDPATCTDNLDYVEKVIEYVGERYRYLQEKILQPFLPPTAES